MRVREDLRAGHAPHSGTHGQNVLLYKGVAVAIALQVIAKAHGRKLCQVLRLQHLQRTPGMNTLIQLNFTHIPPSGKPCSTQWTVEPAQMRPLM